jgi:hypothetical protein
MKTLMKNLLLAFTGGALLLSSPLAIAQGNGKGQEKKGQKEAYKATKHNGKESNGKGKNKFKGKDKSALKKFPHSKPYSVKVPPGHYPPAGHFRIWYPNRPPGHQPAPVRNGMLANAPLTDGAFILYGDKGYDTQYDWRKHEQEKPRSVPREIIDILFPNTTVPAQ